MNEQVIDFIIAVRNEEENISEFVSRIRELSFQNVTIRLLFIEDGSTDKTVEVLRNISSGNPKIKYYSIRNQFGQGAALGYGVERSNADAVITIDIDGSHPISTASKMVQEYLSGAEVVQGNRINYKRNLWYRHIASTVYFFLFSLITGIDLKKQNVHFRLLSNKARKIFISEPGWWYSLRTNFKRNDNIDVNYQPFEAPERVLGRSKFHFRRLLTFAYFSFLSLISVPRFLMLNLFLFFLIVLAGLTWNFWISILLFCLVLINGLFFYRLKMTSIKDAVSLIESSELDPVF